ncbi:Gfo/Idh/MocA family oxidoreductase [Georgenia satyanarayanai]|uniref:Gfo/Idh/MocA family protein n=1 Tax=Georgenia satyanarayanai TaxID=860221 RepID=UPI00203F2865|nr:Gfo/Idh/MocA family oxidoreductase [Georgenia satyanarayanai]MCM3661238.1 Gfo/Idh/MocA family oxidoreductase [Georgenia satyanarayanai]
MTRLSTALVGFGHAGRVFHGPLIADDARYSLDVVVTSDPGRAADAARLHPQARVVADLAEALAAQPDVVIVASPPATHVPVATAALDAGCAVVVDKPLGPDPAQARTLLDRADRLGRPLTVFHNRRWDSEFLTVRRLLAEGALGEVRRLESRLERWKTAETKAWKAVATWREGGGVLFDLGSHLVDQAITLLGPVTDVHAELASVRGGADDDAFVSLSHAGGARSHLWVSTTTADPGPRLRVVGTDATFVMVAGDVQEAQLAGGMRPSAPGYGRGEDGRLVTADGSRPVPSEPGRYQDFYGLLASALREGAPLPVDPRDALAVVELVEGVHRSG